MVTLKRVLFVYVFVSNIEPWQIMTMSVDLCPEPGPFIDCDVNIMETDGFPMRRYLNELGMQSQWLQDLLDPDSTSVNDTIEAELARDNKTFPMCYFKRTCAKSIKKIVYWRIINPAPLRARNCWLVEAIPWVYCTGDDPEFGEAFDGCHDTDVGLTCHPLFSYQYVWVWCRRGRDRGFNVFKLGVSSKCATLKYPCIANMGTK